ncbi:MAG TPA: hypothetical protein VGQ40_05430 [Chthoniobacterales bacterium]|nr:hypothetical protein [Chthoniobacterales bacterium]
MKSKDPASFSVANAELPGDGFDVDVNRVGTLAHRFGNFLSVSPPSSTLCSAGGIGSLAAWMPWLSNSRCWNHFSPRIASANGALIAAV